MGSARLFSLLFICTALTFIRGQTEPYVYAPTITSDKWNGTEICSEGPPSPSNFYPSYQLLAGQLVDTAYMKYKNFSGVNISSTEPLYVPNMPSIPLSYSNCLPLYYPYYNGGSNVLIGAGPYPVGTLTLRCDLNETAPGILLVGGYFNGQYAQIDYGNSIVSYLFLPLNTSLPPSFEFLAHAYESGIATTVRLLPIDPVTVTEIGIKSATAIPLVNLTSTFNGTYICPSNSDGISDITVWNVSNTGGFNLNISMGSSVYVNVANFTGLLKNEEPTQATTPWVVTPENQVFVPFYGNAPAYFYIPSQSNGTVVYLSYDGVTCTLTKQLQEPSCGRLSPRWLLRSKF